nr:hypothetical protein BCU62_16050 [Enterovibrio norvegicus]
MLSNTLRDKIAIRKAIRIGRISLFKSPTTKTWPCHVYGLNPTNADFNIEEASHVICRALLSDVAVFEIISSLHTESNETVLEDRNITIRFLDRCKEVLNGS